MLTIIFTLFLLALLIALGWYITGNSRVRLYMDMALGTLILSGAILDVFSESWFVLLSLIAALRIASRAFLDIRSENSQKLGKNSSQWLHTQTRPTDTPEQSTGPVTSITLGSTGLILAMDGASTVPSQNTSLSTSSPAPEDIEPTLRDTGFDDPPTLRSLD